jgi:tRNA(fMet)-specific endonuclease VapC
VTERGLLDTSTVVLLGCLDADRLPGEPLIAAITLAELSVAPLVATSRKERAARQAVLQQAEAEIRPIPFDAGAARAFGRVAASLRAAGRTVRARSHGAMIAAVAVAEELPLVTANPGDVTGIEGLDLRSIEHPGHDRRWG